MAGMWTLIRNGGVVPMSFILLFGGVALLAAFYFAVRAEPKILGFVKWMSLAVLFSTCAATCADVGMTLYAAERVMTDKTVPERPGPPPTDASQFHHAIHTVIAGCAESTSPGILGFSFLGLTAMLTAVGRRRLDEKEQATRG